MQKAHTTIVCNNHKTQQVFYREQESCEKSTEFLLSFGITFAVTSCF